MFLTKASYTAFFTKLLSTTLFSLLKSADTVFILLTSNSSTSDFKLDKSAFLATFDVLKLASFF